jgi:rRNA-processing protein FCF1
MSKKTAQPLKIILDSNALFTPLELKIDIFEELQRLLNRNIECIVIHPVKLELELLANKESTKLRRQANFALRLLDEKWKIVEVYVSDKITTDDAIVKKDKKWNTPVFTNDRQLRKRLRDISLPVIYVRQKSRLEIDGLIS